MAHLPVFGASGFAVIGAIVAVLFISAVTTMLMVIASSETLIAASHRNGIEALCAADAMAEWSVHELESIADWDRLLSGETGSPFGDGASDGLRRTADGFVVNPGEAVNVANCGHPEACVPSEIAGNTSGDRPWGPDNPVWQLFAHGPLTGLLPEVSVATPLYVLSMVARDPANNGTNESPNKGPVEGPNEDPNKDNDALEEPNHGIGRILLRAAAIGPQHTHRVVQLTIARPRHRGGTPDMPPDPAQRPLQVVSWHVIR